MTPNETRRALDAPSRTPAQAFAILRSIAHQLGQKPEDPEAQSLLIRALEHREDHVRQGGVDCRGDHRHAG